MSLNTLGLIVNVMGLTLVVIAIGLVSRHAQPPTWDVRKWKPIWRQRGDFRRGGFVTFIAGLSLGVIGAVMRLL